MINSDIKPPIKPRRKHLEVPVHKPERDNSNQQKIKRTYSANFSSRKHRHKNDCPENVPTQKYSEVIIELPERESSHRMCRKGLTREIEKLTRENEEIVEKFNELEELSVNRILKLKEKVNHLQDINADISKQAESVRYQYDELLKCYDDVRNQLELNKVCKNCEKINETLRKINEENDILRKKNSNISEDLNMLKTVIFRLNVQLERYQEKLRKYNLSLDKSTIHLRQEHFSSSQLRDGEIINIFSSDHQNHKHTPISWGAVNSHTLGPLLDAYQDTINEKDEIIQNYELELAKFTGQMKEIIEENEELYKKLTEDENCSTKLKTQLENIKEEIKVTKEQNDALIKKCAMKQDKIEEILRIYENKVGQMKRDYQVIHDEYIKLRAENNALKDKIKSLVDSQDDFKNERQNYIPIAVHTASVNECKKWYEELKHQYENEKEKLKENIDWQAKVIRELNESIRILKKSKEEIEEKVLHLEKELKKAETRQLDLEHTLNEVQLSKSACRKQLHKAMTFAKELVAEQETLLEALNMRQQENKAVKKFGTDMAQKMDTLKSQLKDVQKSAWQEFSTVEQRIHEQGDLIESMKDEHTKEIERLQQVIKEQEEKISKETKKEAIVPVSPYKLFKDKYS